MNDWRLSTWGDEISLEYGKGIRGYADGIGKVRVYGTNGPVGWTDKALANGPGVILGRKGAYRGVQYSPDPFFVIDTAFYAVPKTPLNMRWLYYAMIFYELGKIDDGSPIPSTTRAAVYPIDLKVPPENVQNAIANVLGSLDDKIEQNRRTGAKLEELARAVFKAWFVDFEPVKAKAAGATAFPGMPPETFATLPTRLIDSPLGPVPARWEIRKIRDLCSRVENGGTPKRQVDAYWSPPEVPWLTSGEVRQSFVMKTENFISKVGLDNSSAKLWPRFTTVVALYGATAGIATMLGTEVCANQACCGLLPTIAKCFVHQVLSNSLVNLQQRARGSAQQNLSQSIVADFECVTASDTILRAFECFALPLYETCMHLSAESAKLATLRDYLLPRLLSGQVRVNHELSSTEFRKIP